MRHGPAAHEPPDRRAPPAASPVHRGDGGDALAGLPWHVGVVTTVFWVGEPPTADNCCIANDQSAWDTHWARHFGGYDDPDHRAGFAPAAFVPRENAFYVALPYDDRTEEGGCRREFAREVPWARGRSCEPGVSVLKNRWVEVRFAGRTCFAQWEDAGPYFYDDAPYVFGSARPRNETDTRGVAPRAGLDVSPAVRDCLGPLTDGARTDWRFVEAADVPPGPWRDVVTTRQIETAPAARRRTTCRCPARCAGLCEQR